MNELKQCEFFLLRYVPDPVKDEFVNIGVVMTEGEQFAELRMTRDWSRVRCMDPDADVEMLSAIEAEFRSRLNSGSEARAAILKKLDDSFSNLLQISGTKACLATDPQVEIESLAKLYLDSNRREKLSRESGARSRIFTGMRAAFAGAGVWEQMWKRVPVNRYSGNDDPLKIDCGYKPNGVVRMFHALSLEADVNPAKVLAYSYPVLWAGIMKQENAKLELTAIVEPHLDPADPTVAFARTTLDKSSIRIAGLDKMPEIAEKARAELKL